MTSGVDVGDAIEQSTRPGDKTVAFIIYVLYIAGTVYGGVVNVVAVVICYLARRNATDELLTSHYTYQIWVFWVSFLASVFTLVMCVGLFFSGQKIIAAIAGTVLAVSVVVGMMTASVYGLMRLNNDKRVLN